MLHCRSSTTSCNMEGGRFPYGIALHTPEYLNLWRLQRRLLSIHPVTANANSIKPLTST